MLRLPSIAIVLLIAVASLAAGLVLAASGSSETVRSGAGFMVQSPDRWLAFVGLGLVSGTLARPAWPGFVAAVIAGSVFGVASRHSFLGPWITGPSVFARLHFLGPAACLLMGLLLMTRGRWRSLSTPFVVFAVTAALLLIATINDPAPQGHAFVAGAALAATGLRKSVV